MLRRIFQLAAIAIVLLAALTPLMECFDHWDARTGPAGDSEIHFTAFIVGVGIVFSLAELLRYIPLLTRTRQNSCTSSAPQRVTQQRDIFPVAPTASPPLIPLRI